MLSWSRSWLAAAATLHCRLDAVITCCLLLFRKDCNVKHLERKVINLITTHSMVHSYHKQKFLASFLSSVPSKLPTEKPLTIVKFTKLQIMHCRRPLPPARIIKISRVDPAFITMVVSKRVDSRFELSFRLVYVRGRKRPASGSPRFE